VLLSARAVREYLEALDDEAMKFLEEPKKPQMTIPLQGRLFEAFRFGIF
jgi:hypothetical protein